MAGPCGPTAAAAPDCGAGLGGGGDEHGLLGPPNGPLRVNTSEVNTAA